MTDNIYGIALYFPPTVTVGRVYELLERLDDRGIYADRSTLEFASDGLYCEAEYNAYICVNAETVVKEVGNGDVVLDLDTMCEWLEEEE